MATYPNDDYHEAILWKEALEDAFLDQAIRDQSTKEFELEAAAEEEVNSFNEVNAAPATRTMEEISRILASGGQLRGRTVQIEPMGSRESSLSDRSRNRMAQDNKTTDGSHDTTGTEAENSEEILHSSSKGATAAPPVLQSPAVKKMVLCVVMVMLFFFIASLAFAIALLIEIRQDNGQAVQVTEQLAPTSATTPIDLPPYPSPVWPATAPAIALIPEQNQNASTPSSSSSQPARAPIQAPSMNNPAIPSFVEPVSRPTLPTQQPQQGVQPTTSSPTVSPHFEETRAILIERSPSSQAALSRHSSPQYLALEWLVQEEDASTYSVQRLIQRWVMATVFYSLGGGRSNSSSWTRSDNWLDRTTNECSWYTVVPDNGCDQHGNITGIDLRDNNLFGTIPHEISLLSNHLVRLFLQGNEMILGSIPSSFGDLSQLRRLHLDECGLSGTLSTELGRMTTLESFNLGQNKYSGKLPSELGSMKSLQTLGLEKNQFVGTIPTEFGQLSLLETLQLEENLLSGSVPSEIASLAKLQYLKVNSNSLTGEISNEICQNSLSVLEVDCDDVSCSCCEFC